MTGQRSAVRFRLAPPPIAREPLRWEPHRLDGTGRTFVVADAIRDVTKRKGIVLDPFGGSGTTIIAAEKTGRRARAIELEPKFVDVAVRRWERYTGKATVLDGTGQTFEDLDAERTAANDSAVAGKEVA